MKLKSETKQTIQFLRDRFQVSQQDKTVIDRCQELKLNYDMVQRGLIKLAKLNVIGRDSRGPRSKYVYPSTLGLGDVIEAIQGIELGNEILDSELKQTLNKVKL
jgi:hypothetical protein